MLLSHTYTQVFSHGFPYHPTALAYDVLQSLVAVGNDRGTIRIYPLIFNSVCVYVYIRIIVFQSLFQLCKHYTIDGNHPWIATSYRNIVTT